MNTNPNAKRILCFGDSLTRGSNPGTSSRLAINERLTGILQDLLGNSFEVIEEGLGGRTTNIDDPTKEGRNGLTYFKGCFPSHLPLDLVVILLGTNDLKPKYKSTPDNSAKALISYNQVMNDACQSSDMKKPKILIITPPTINESAVPADWELDKVGKIVEQMIGTYSQVAQKIGAEFLDITKSVFPSITDGVNLDKENNQKLAQEVYKIVSKI